MPPLPGRRLQPIQLGLRARHKSVVGAQKPSRAFIATSNEIVGSESCVLVGDQFPAAAIQPFMVALLLCRDATGDVSTYEVLEGRLEIRCTGIGVTVANDVGPSSLNK